MSKQAVAPLDAMSQREGREDAGKSAELQLDPAPQPVVYSGDNNPPETLKGTFGEELGISGVKHVCSNQANICRRFLWVAVLLGALTLVIVSLYTRVSHYLGHPKSVDMSVTYVGKLKFPAVTICNQNMLRTTAVHSYGYRQGVIDPYRWPFNDSNIYRFMNDLLSVWEATSYQDNLDRLHTFKFLFKDLATPKVPINWEVLYKWVAHTKENMIIQCTFKGTICGPDNFTLTFTDLGVCYTFNPDPETPIYTEQAGSLGGLTLTLNVEQYEKMRGFSKAAGIRVLLQDQSESNKLVKNYGYSLVPGTITSLVMNYEQYTELGHPYGDCTEEGGMMECLLRCSTGYMLEVCLCKQLHMSVTGTQNSDLCSPFRLVECAMPRLTRFVSLANYSTYCGRCKPKCERVDYRVTMSMSQLSDFDRMVLALNTPQRPSNFLPALRLQNEAVLLISDPDYINRIHDLAQDMRQVDKSIVEISPVAEAMLKATDVLGQKVQSKNNLQILFWGINATVYKLYNESIGIQQYMLSTYFFDYLIMDRTHFDAYSGEDFVSRSADDIVSQSGKMSEFVKVFKASLNSMVSYADTLTQNLSSFCNAELAVHYNADSAEMIACHKDLLQPTRNVTQYLSLEHDWLNKMYSKYQKVEQDVTKQPQLLETARALRKSATDNYYRNNFLQLEVYFEEMSKFTLTQQAADNFISLLCDFGGSLGLYLGGSILTVVELLDICIIYCGRRKQ